MADKYFPTALGYGEKLDHVPRHRLTGINCYKDPKYCVDEWARVEELRAEGLASGGKKPPVLGITNS